MRLVLPFVLVSLPLALLGCDQSTEAQEPEPVSGALTRHEPTRVRVEAATRREMVRTLETTTVVESEHHVVLHANSTGELVELLAEEGDTVEAGAVLARLDQRDAAAQLADARIALKEAEDAAAKEEIAQREAEGNIEKARLAFEQAKRNYERNEAAQLISAQDLEKLKLDMETADSELEAAILAKDRAAIEGRAAQTAVERARLMVERAEVTLSHTELRAPFAGVIAERKCQQGDHITAAEEAFVLTDLGALRTVFYRPQRELALFAGLGLAGEDGAVGVGFEAIEVSAESEALPGHTFHGHIERISPSIDATSGSFRVTVRLEPESDGLRLLPGMLLRLRLVVERHPGALVVPKRALKREGDTTLVFVAREREGTRVAERVVVSEGFSDDREVEVSVVGGGTLEAGDEVVIVGNRDLEDGKELEIVSEEAEPEEAEPMEPEPEQTAEPEQSAEPGQPTEPAEPQPAESEDAGTPE